MRISDWSADVCSSDLFEGDGTLINYEGRAQRHFQVFDPTYYDASIGLVESWRWLADLEGASGWKILDDVTVACAQRSEEHTSELQSLMRISYAVFCLKKKKEHKHITNRQTIRIEHN